MNALPQLFPQSLQHLPFMVDLDQIEADMHERLGTGEAKPCDHETAHRFTPGLYIREWRAPPGTLAMSKLHNSEHPFVVSQGAAVVWGVNEPRVLIRAPFTGITKPGTRRLLLVLEDIIWTTFHPTEETDVDKIEAQLITPHNPWKNLKERAKAS